MASIVLNVNDKKYKLEYNRASIVKMEEKGFDVQDIESKPISTIVMLERGAFYMHNPSLEDDEIDAICENVGGDEKFIAKLTELYMDALKSLTGDKKDKSKNVKWENA